MLTPWALVGDMAVKHIGKPRTNTNGSVSPKKSTIKGYITSGYYDICSTSHIS